MKIPKLTFYVSSNKNLIYKIFRFKNKNKDFNIDYYINNKSDLSLNEVTPNVSIENLSLNEVTPNVSIENLTDYQMTLIDDDDFYKATLPFDFINNNSKFTLNFKNYSPAYPHNKLRVTLGIDVISKVEYMINAVVTKVITDQVEIEKLIKVINNNTIDLNKLEFNSNSVSIDVSVSNISVLDNLAHGIYEPNVSFIETKDYLNFYQNLNSKFNRYFYTAIGVNGSTITELSDTKVIDIGEKDEEIKTIIESCDNYSSPSPVWSIVNGDYTPADEIKVYKNKNEMASSIIKIFDNHEIKFNDHLLASDGIRIIKMPNIWHSSKRSLMLRERKAFRFKNISYIYPSIESEYSEPISFSDHLEVLIDKAIVLKKNVTSLPDDVANLPLTIHDINAEKVITYIRQGGIYYKEYLNNQYETNEEENEKDVMSLVTLDSRLPLLTIRDNCIYSNKYNYTVYLFDETGNMSEPIWAVG